MWCARELVGNEPFALLLPDVLVKHERGCLAQMIDAAQRARPRQRDRGRGSADGAHPQYGVVGVGETKGKMFKVTEMVEKPPREKAPSNLIITGRYILQPEIFDVLATQEPRRRRRDPAHRRDDRARQEQPFYGLKFEGESFDCGSKIGFLAANVAYALDAARHRAGVARWRSKRLMGES